MSVTIGNLTVQNTNEQTPNFNHNNNGSTLVLIINSNTNNTVNNIPAYNGVNMILIQKISDGSRRCWMYYLDNVPQGNNVVDWGMTGPINHRSQVISLVGTDIVGGSLGAIGSDTNGTSVQVILGATESGSRVIGGICKQTNENIVPGADTVELDDAQIAAVNNRGWAGWETGGGAVTIDASWATPGAASFNVAEFQVDPSLAMPRRTALFI